MLAYSTELQGKTLTLKCSDGRELTATNWESIASFLLQPTTNNMAVVWNIDKFVDDITTTMSADVRNKVLKGGRVYTPDNRKLYYQPSRKFGINHIDFYSLQRYSNDAIDDVVKLAEFGDRVIKAFEQFGIKKIDKLTSPVAVYSEVLNDLEFPRTCDLPEDAFELTQMCAKTMSREWRDVYQLGHWDKDEISDYDLTSAYWYLIAKLPDIRNAKFFKSKTFPSTYSWGELYGKLKIVKPVSPFIYQPKNCYPIGEWEDSISTDQLWLLNKWGIGTFTMEYGNFFTLPEHYSYPFKATMEGLYKLRENGDDIVKKIAKGVAVGIGGKFAEIYSDGRLGDNFNSIYGRLITSRCVVMVADFIYRSQMENDIVSILVDGVLATKRITLNGNRGMGAWRMNEPMPALVLSLLNQWQGNKKPSNITYSQIMGAIKENPDYYSYGEADMNLLNYSRDFLKLPKTGGELITNKYYSKPYEVKEVVCQNIGINTT